MRSWPCASFKWLIKPRFVMGACALTVTFSASSIQAQSELITEQGAIPALFEEVGAATAESILANEPYLQQPFVDRVRVLRVRSELLRRDADIDESSPLYLNLFPDLGLRIYIHGRIEREYGVDWLASPFPDSNGRTFVNLIDTIGAHPYSGLRVEMNTGDPRFDGIGIAQINGTDYVAATERVRDTRHGISNLPDLILYQSSGVVLSEPEHSFFVEAGVRTDYGGQDVHFVTENTGYLITHGGLYHRNASRLLRTTDGGRDWQLINDALPGTPRRIHFTDLDTGYLTLTRPESCQTDSNCPGATSLVMKTEDAGISWTGLDLPESVGTPYIFGVNGDDRLYGVFLSPPPGQTRVLRASDDGGISWKDIYRFPAGEIVTQAEFVEGHAFISFYGGELFSINVDTGQGAEIAVSAGALRAFRAPSADTIIAEVDRAGARQLLMTADGGASWTHIPLEDRFELVAAPAQDELVLIINTGTFGPDDTASTIDVIAYSDDAGVTWEQTLSIGGLLFDTKKAQSVSSGVHKVLLSNRIITVQTPSRK